METDFHLICEDSRQFDFSFDFLLGWTLFKEWSMRNACDTAPLKPLVVSSTEWGNNVNTRKPSQEYTGHLGTNINLQAKN